MNNSILSPKSEREGSKPFIEVFIEVFIFFILLFLFSIKPVSFREKEYDKALQAEGGKEERKKKIMKEYMRKESDYLRFKRVKLGPNVFQTLKVIGKGAFGEVHQARFFCLTFLNTNQLFG
jgi:hypothetical protein